MTIDSLKERDLKIKKLESEILDLKDLIDKK